MADVINHDEVSPSSPQTSHQGAESLPERHTQQTIEEEEKERLECKSSFGRNFHSRINNSA